MLPFFRSITLYLPEPVKNTVQKVDNTQRNNVLIKAIRWEEMKTATLISRVEKWNNKQTKMLAKKC